MYILNHSVTKRIILLLTLFFFTVHLYGQIEKRNLIMGHVAIGISGLGYYPAQVGGNSYDAKYYYGIGLDYSRQLSKRWDLCSGFEYTVNRMTARPELTGREEYDHGRFKAKLSLASIPVEVKYHVGELVYFQGGLIFNVLAKLREEQWQKLEDKTSNLALTLGFGLGIGFQHEFNSGIILSLYPYLKWHGVGEHLKFAQIGANLGVGYTF